MDQGGREDAMPGCQRAEPRVPARKAIGRGTIAPEVVLVVMAI